MVIELDEWINSCDTDGRGICFTFYDSDIKDLKDIFERNNGN